MVEHQIDIKRTDSLLICSTPHRENQGRKNWRRNILSYCSQCTLTSPSRPSGLHQFYSFRKETAPSTSASIIKSWKEGPSGIRTWYLAWTSVLTCKATGSNFQRWTRAAVIGKSKIIEEDCNKRAFSSLYGPSRLSCMPFGLKNDTGMF